MVYRVEGTVVRLLPEQQLAVIQHETIANDAGEVWMEAMTMEFPIASREDFARLRKGQRLKARLLHSPNDYEYWLDQIEILPAAPPPPAPQ